MSVRKNCIRKHGPTRRQLEARGAGECVGDGQALAQIDPSAYADFICAVVATDAALFLQRAQTPGETATSEIVEDEQDDGVVVDFDLELH
jgi:hypothetical protein